MPHVVVPPPYRGPTRGLAEIEVAGETVGECLEDAGRRYPGLSDQIFDGDGRVHRFVNLFVNGEEIGREELARGVAADDRVEILAAIAGGAGAAPRRGGPPVDYPNPNRFQKEVLP